ncbi:HD-GYP domain-containing protein [Pseudodesulfovibrio senegalensis]|uniref:HD-GYP domain-containing protein n=1 Tax=Pseudodesulfovibrio senegalensis TaxID=1721087 RepID=A0A6N6N377_9BACT|nr:HD-GYP domain-containing protein [Pseudodesulfovibrio senegalensis]KAB1441835.1 HD-GYP domain-containing protein [Pseudodesulfovibrio senegalensis]
MAKMNIPEYRISVDRLRPGVFIRLEKTGWFSHPFLFNSFKITSPEQIDILRQLGVGKVLCIPEKSDVLPGAQDEKPVPAPCEPDATRQMLDEMWELKRERTRRLEEKKQRMAECENHYFESVRDITNIMKGMVRGNGESVLDAREFVRRLARHFLEDRESTLHLMNVLPRIEPVYSHSLNVAVLSMMAGREAGFSKEQMELLGMGALFHDIGKTRIEKKLLRKRGPLTKPEQELLEKHPEFGVEILAKIADFPAEALPAVAQHHERADGSGYPDGLTGEQTDRLARMVNIANSYDNLCNNSDPEENLTPYLALSYMFGQGKALYDMELLTSFIRCLGVYPPGTVVQLTNGTIGMVMSVNPANQLRPSVVLYDSEIPKKEALIVELADEAELQVEKSIRLSHLPPEIFEYLNPRSRITYYVDPDDL